MSSLALIIWFAGVSAQSKAYYIDGFYYHIIENPYFHVVSGQFGVDRVEYIDNRNQPEYNKYIICEYDQQGNATYFRYDRNGELIPDPYGIYYDYFDGNDTIVSISTMGITDNCKGEVTIPSTVSIEGKSYVVGVIEDMAFIGCKEMTSIVIPASVTYIPNGAFYGCDNLTSIVIAAGNPVYDSRDNCNAVIETRKNSLIASCKNTVISPTANEIGEAAFWGRKDLSAINIPNNITNIGKWAFLDCTGLTTAALSSSMTAIETGVFEGCTDLASIEIPSSIASIGENAFNGCYNLTFEIPATLTDISENAFNGIGTLYWNSNIAPSPAVRQSAIRNLVFGNDVTEINWTVEFAGLRSITIPSSITKIGKGALWHLNNLETIYWNSKYPLSETSIIQSNINLKSLVLGDAVSYLEPYIFYNSYLLESITVDPNNPYFDSRENCNAVIGRVNADFDYDDDLNNIHYHSAITKDCLVLGCRNSIIPDGVTVIGPYAFINKYVSSFLPSLILPGSVTRIDDYAFSSTVLDSIYIPSSVSYISPTAFANCDLLESIKVDPGNTVYNSAGDCNAIIETAAKKLALGCYNTIIPDGTAEIGEYAFAGCYRFNTINIPSSVTSIGKRAFQNCYYLDNLTLPSGIRTLGEYAFVSCSNLSSLIIPEGVKTIEDGLLEGCENLKSVIIPSSVDSIGQYAFANCSSLESIIIPEGVRIINHGTFNDCSSLSYLSLPSTIVKFALDNQQLYSLGFFANCDNLQTAGLKGGGYNYEFSWQDTIPANAFFGLTNLESVHIPQNIKAVYECELQANIAVNNSAYCEPNEMFPVNFAYDCGSVGAVFYGCDSLKKVAVAFKNTKLMQLWRDQENNDSLSFRESPMDFNLYKLNPIKSITILDDSINDLSSILTKDIKEVVVSQYVQYVDSSMFKSGSKTVALDRLYFNPNIDYYRPRNFDLESNLEKITVESDNRYYSSVDGVLLNKDGSRLILCPDKRNDGYRIPETVVTVDAESFKYCKGLKFVRIPGSVERIGERAFEGCSSIDWITFEGSPEIGLNAFGGCQNIRSIAAHSNIPGIMHLNTTPQPIITGDYNSIVVSNGLTVTPKYNEELGRKVSEINSTATTWSCPIVTEDVSSGQYKMIVGVLPNLDQMPNKFSVKVVAILEDNTPITLFSGRQGPKTISFNASGTQYDSVFVRDLTFPDGCKSIEITLTSVKGADLTKRMVLDRIFLEPTGEDFPEDAYAGPFTQRVFNNAMLYVPDGALSTYQAASGWKLFKNIDIDTDVAPIIVDDRKDGRGIVINNMIIYDPMGRKVDVESIDMLAPGLYIIDGSTFLIK